MFKSDVSENPYPRTSLLSTFLRSAGIVLLILLVVWTGQSTDINLDRLLASPSRIGDFVSRMVPPDTTLIQTAVNATVETFQIAFLGTFLSVIISFPLGLLAAVNLTPEWVHQPVKSFLSVLRAIPVIILALLFVSAVGLGAFPGVLAITVHSIGMLGKFYAEAFENARSGSLEALDSAGATWWQKVRYAVLIEVSPDLMRDTLFRLELNIRESAILGLVGAGGIGFYIQLHVRSFQYDKVATLTIAVVLMTMVVEQISIRIRKRLR